jgi:hypothetical protein
LTDALTRVAALRVDSQRLRANALRFSRERHEHAMSAVIADTMQQPAGTMW